GINKKKVKERLKELHNRGVPLQKSFLMQSPSHDLKRLARNIIALSRGENGQQDYAKYVSSLTGIPEEDIKSSQDRTERNVQLTEGITHLLALWAPIVGVDIEEHFSVNEGKIKSGKEERSYFYYKD